MKENLIFLINIGLFSMSHKMDTEHKEENNPSVFRKQKLTNLVNIVVRSAWRLIQFRTFLFWT